MPKKTPSYRQRKGYDQAIVTLTDAVTRERRDYWLGAYDTPQSRERYHRLIAEWEANRRVLPARTNDSDEEASGPTVMEVIAAYWQWVQSYYHKDEATAIRIALRILKQMFGSTSARSFGPKGLRMIRQAMVSGKMEGIAIRRRWSRPFINRQIQKIVMVFKWAASQEMVPASIYQQLKTVEPLRRGKTTAPEPPPVLPVSDELVDPIESFVSKQVWALIQLQRYTSARCGELFKLRPCDLKTDPSGIWTFMPDEHKTAYRGKKRIIYFGPRAQSVVNPFLAERPMNCYLFSPAEAEQERREVAHARRKTPLSCGNRPGTHCVDEPRCFPGDHYTTDSYRRAIARACDMAFPPPEQLARQKIKGKKGTRWETQGEWQRRLGPKRWEELQKWHRDHRWHPHQLRHSAATRIRRQFGLEAAQIALGHSSALVTEAVYAERDMQKAIEVMQTVG